MPNNQFLASKIVVQEESPSLRSIPTLDTSIMSMVGITQKGPVGVATLTQSFAQYVAIYGLYISGSDMTAAAEGFFENGGTNLWVVRVVHYADITVATPSSAKATIVIPNATPVTTLTANGKYDGTYANGYKIVIAAATSGTAAEFNLTLQDSTSLVLETYPNLTMDATAPRYALTIVNDAVNGSTRIALVDAGVSASTTVRRPANATLSPMASGSDGLGSISDVDYVGSSASSTGLRALDIVDDLTLLAVPGIATSAVHNAMLTYCEVTRQGQVFAILDPPANNTASQIVTYVSSTAAIEGLSEFGSVYWPRIQILNPNTTLYGTTANITVPPSGHIAGMIARNDNAKVGGVWTTPAGTEEGILFGCLGFETVEVLKEEVRDIVFPQNVNPITTMKTFPRYVDGARNLKTTGNWPSVAQRRGVSFVERSIKLGLQFGRHKNNTQSLRATLTRTCKAFLRTQMDVGAFASTDPDKAFFVDFGDRLNPAGSNVVTGRIGLATVRPTEFIVLKFSQDTRAIDSST